MQAVVLSFDNLNNQGDDFAQMFALRKRLFVDQMQWDIPHTEQIEMDQYDNIHAVYVCVKVDGRIVGGTRLLRTDARVGGYTYMVKDAHVGVLPPFPPDIAESEPPASADVFEATRFFVDPGLDGRERNEVLAEVARAAHDAVRDRGGRSIIAIMSPGFLIWFKRLGLVAKRAGATFRVAGDAMCVLTIGVSQQPLTDLGERPKSAVLA